MPCNALVCSWIDYSNSLLIHTKQTHYELLPKVLNRAARIVTGSQRYEHIASALKELGWLRIKSRVVMKPAVLVFKTLTGLAPSYLSDGLKRYNANRSLRCNDSPIIHLSLGSAKKKSGRGAWCVAGPIIWNELPISTRTEGVKMSTFLSLLYETLYSRTLTDFWVFSFIHCHFVSLFLLFMY